MIAINVAAFVAGSHAADPGAFILAFAAVPYDITHGIVLPPPSPPAAALTILSAMFVHAGTLHLATNMLVLALFGPELEARCGHLRFAAFYLAGGVAGELLQIAVAPGSHLPALGASGAIAAVLGGSLLTFPVRAVSLIVIGVWAAAQFAGGYGVLTSPGAIAQPGTAYLIHIGGFAFGVFAIGRFRRPDAGMRASSW